MDVKVSSETDYNIETGIEQGPDKYIFSTKSFGCRE
jgi:hypothetical protein